MTGASAGIGEGLARRLAEGGADLMLVSRRRDRLEELARQLRVHGPQVYVVALDLAAPDALAEVREELARLDRRVDILVNNAGFMLPADFADWRADDVHRFLQLMLMVVCDLTHETLPGMIERRFGRVLNVASLQGLLPGAPGHALYGAVKAFLVSFSDALSQEVRHNGVHVTALCPGLTRTDFFDLSNRREQFAAMTPSWIWQDVPTVVDAGLRALEANQRLCVPGLPNRLIATTARLLPESLRRSLSLRVSHRFR